MCSMTRCVVRALTGAAALTILVPAVGAAARFSTGDDPNSARSSCQCGIASCDAAAFGIAILWRGSGSRRRIPLWAAAAH